MTSGNFTKNNDSFCCENCGKKVPPAEKTCRNHCPYCLHSKHVDLMPGDRANPCRGLLIPRSYENDSKKGLMIHFLCQKCGFKGRNIAITDDANAGDDYEKILSLSSKS